MSHDVSGNMLSILHAGSHLFPTKLTSITGANSLFLDPKTNGQNPSSWHSWERQSSQSNSGYLVLEPTHSPTTLFLAVAYADYQCLCL